MSSNVFSRKIHAAFLVFVLASLGWTSLQARVDGGMIRICATVPDLGYFAREIGGDQVSVAVFAKGPEDPHFLEAKPGFIKALNQADLFILVGMELEVGWVPPLLKNARNARVLPGAGGYLDVSTAITPLGVPAGPVDRSMGDVHPQGNPHYLLDPLNGLKVARLITDRLIELRPEKAQLFNERFSAFRRRVGNALVGEKLAGKYDFEKLALLAQHGKLRTFLKEQNEETLLGGWLGSALPLYGSKAVGDHDQWPYFANRFGLSMVGFLEPKPGVSPSTKHLGEVVAMMQNDGVKVILTSPYFNPRPVKFVSEKTGARIIPMAHQTGGVEGADDYIAMIDYNVRQMAGGLGAR